MTTSTTATKATHTGTCPVCHDRLMAFASVATKPGSGLKFECGGCGAIVNRSAITDLHAIPTPGAIV